MFSTKIMEIETKETVKSVYNNYEEYEQHTIKLCEKGYKQTCYTCNDINNKIFARYVRNDRKEIIPRIHFRSK